MTLDYARSCVWRVFAFQCLQEEHEVHCPLQVDLLEHQWWLCVARGNYDQEVLAFVSHYQEQHETQQ